MVIIPEVLSKPEGLMDDYEVSGEEMIEGLLIDIARDHCKGV